jgi:hypothetical protein
LFSIQEPVDKKPMQILKKQLKVFLQIDENKTKEMH